MGQPNPLSSLHLSAASACCLLSIACSCKDAQWGRQADSLAGQAQLPLFSEVLAHRTAVVGLCLPDPPILIGAGWRAGYWLTRNRPPSALAAPQDIQPALNTIVSHSDPHPFPPLSPSPADPSWLSLGQIRPKGVTLTILSRLLRTVPHQSHFPYRKADPPPLLLSSNDLQP